MPGPAEPVDWKLPLLLLAGTLCIYAASLNHGFVWDDDSYLTRNSLVTQPGGLSDIWLKPSASPQYYPLVFTGFRFEYLLWGANPAGYRVVNVLLHALAAILLYRLLRDRGLPAAGLAALLFAWHPLQVESVVWIAERKNVLSACFYFASALLLFQGLERRDRLRWGAALLLFAGALLSKSVTASLPAAVALLLWWRGALDRRAWLALLPFFALGLAAGLHTAWLERGHVGAEGATWDVSVVERSLVAGRALCFYAGKWIMPWGISFNYPRWEISASSWWQYLFPFAVLGLTASLWALRRRIGRGPLVALLFFAGTLFPALGFLNVYPFRFAWVADHFQYLACIGLAVPLAWSLQRVARSWTPYAAMPLLLGLAIASFSQTAKYRTPETLWRDTLRKNPDSFLANNNLGNLLMNRKNWREAIPLFRKAIAANPDNYEAWNNLGSAYIREKQVGEAVELYAQAVAQRPGHARLRGNYGNALMLAGRKREARREFERALEIRPDWAEGLNNLAWLLATHADPGVHDPGRAVQLAERARENEALNRAGVLDTLAAAYAAAGRMEDAVRTAKEAVRLARENEGRRDLRVLEARLRLYEAGRPYYER